MAGNWSLSPGGLVTSAEPCLRGARPGRGKLRTLPLCICQQEPGRFCSPTVVLAKLGSAGKGVVSTDPGEAGGEVEGGAGCTCVLDFCFSHSNFSLVPLPHVFANREGRTPRKACTM